MKIISSLLISSMLFSTLSYAECDFSKEITPQDNGYLYSRQCHKKVGELVQDNEDMSKQVNYLKDAIKYQDDIITKEHQRAEMWKDLTYKAEDRMQTMSDWSEKKGWIYFGLGILTTVAAGYALGQVNKAGK